MIKRTLSLALLICLTLSALPKPVMLNTAQKVALNVYYERGTQLKQLSLQEINITGQQALSYQDELLVFVFEMNGGEGYVLVAAESDVFPVLAYSFEGKFILDGLPANIKDWLNTYLEQIYQVRHYSIPASCDITEQWNHYTSADFIPSKSPLNVDPLLSTNWDQGCFYNALCPVAAGGDCNHTWTGCVATAMAMVMKYHNFPEQGMGSHSYNHNLYGVQTADFGSTTYHWSNMPNALYSQNNDVATLMYHCGVSVNMNYGVSGSGAYTADVRNALVNYFSYASSAQYVQRMWYSSSGWESLLRSELDLNQPMVYSGQDPNFGHAFVCDGYQGTDFFHFNWGWSGWNNGYFYVSNLNSGNGNFTSSQAAVVHIVPAPPGPQPSFSANLTQFCAGTSILFQDNTLGNPVSWNWQFPGGNPESSTVQNPSVTYAYPGNFDVILTISDGVNTNTLSKNDYIKVKTKPYALFPEDTTICSNNIISLDAGNPGSSYLWSTGDNSQVITVDSTGATTSQKNIFVEIYTAEGCWNKDSIQITFAPCAAIDEIEGNSILVYPNPSDGEISLTLQIPLKGPANVTIFNEQSVKVRESMILKTSSAMPIELGNLTPGLYIISIELEGKFIYKKLIIK